MPQLESNHITIHYIDEGSGSPLVWLPGETDHAAMAVYAHGPLLDRYRLIAVDPRGQGGTKAFSAAASFAPSLLAADLLGVLDTLGLQRPVLGGHSRGGRAVLEFARQHPERARAVIAVAPPIVGADQGDGLQRASYLRAAERLRRDGLDAFIARLPGAPRNAMLRAEWQELVRAAGAEALAAQYELLAGVCALTNDTGALTMPVLVVCGEHDRRLDDARRLAAALPAARLAIIPGAGHLPFIESKAPYFAALTDFLASVAD